VNKQPAFIYFLSNWFSKQNGDGFHRCQAVSVVPALVFEGWGL
jgi:hypothetical protein